MKNINNEFSRWAKLGVGLSLSVALLTLQGCTTMAKAVSANQGAVEDRVFRVKIEQSFNLYNNFTLFDKAGYELSDTGQTLFNHKLIFKV